MAIGQILIIQNNSATLILSQSQTDVPSLAMLNPNDGVCYIKLNGAASASPAAWDWKLPSQSYGLFPGPWQSLGVYYLDQSGSGRQAEINVYDAQARLIVPEIHSIGRAVQVAGTTYDITEGNKPANPPLGTSRIWVDVNGVMHIIGDDGDEDIIITDESIAAYVNPANINHNALQNLAAGDAHPQYVIGTGDQMSGSLTVSKDAGAINAGSYNANSQYLVDSAGPNTPRIGFHWNGVIGFTLYLQNDHSRPFLVVSNASVVVELLTNTGTQTVDNKTIQNSVWRMPYYVPGNGAAFTYGSFNICNVNGGTYYLPLSNGHAGEMIIAKNWSGGNTGIYCQGGNVIGLGANGGAPASIITRYGDAYTFMSDGGQGWMVV